jgi:hypothetical protein
MPPAAFCRCGNLGLDSLTLIPFKIVSLRMPDDAIMVVMMPVFSALVLVLMRRGLAA